MINDILIFYRGEKSMGAKILFQLAADPFHSCPIIMAELHTKSAATLRNRAKGR